MRPRLLSITCLLLVACLGVLSPPARAADTLEWVEFSLGGRPVRVKAGGILALHPDAAFRVSAIHTSDWLDQALGGWLGTPPRARLKEAPGADLGQFHSLSELLGPQAYEKNELSLEVIKDGRVIGRVGLVVRTLPIDWLRRAQAAVNPQDKIKYLQRALELTPDDHLLMMRLVDLLTENRRYSEAVQTLEKYAANSDDPAILKRLARLYQRLGKLQKAAAALSQLLADNPQDPELLDTLARIYQKAGRWSEAAGMLTRLAQVQPASRRADTLLTLAGVLEKAGKEEEAGKALERALALRPRDAGLWQRVAEYRRRQGRQGQALAALERAVKLSPGDRKLRRRLVDALLEDGRKEQAARQLEELAALEPNDAALLTRLARIYQDLGDKARLLEAYRRLARIRPGDADLKYNLAVIALDQGQAEQALAYLEAASRLKPEDREIARTLLEARLKLGRWDRACRQLAAMLEKRPQDLAPLEAAYPLLAKKRPRRLARIIRQALEANPKQAKLYEMATDLALAQKDLEQAREVLERGIQALPHNLRLQYSLSVVYEAQGRRDKALGILERILDQNPDYPGAEERYLQLRTRYLKEDTSKKGEKID